MHLVCAHLLPLIISVLLLAQRADSQAASTCPVYFLECSQSECKHTNITTIRNVSKAYRWTFIADDAYDDPQVAVECGASGCLTRTGFSGVKATRVGTTHTLHFAIVSQAIKGTWGLVEDGVQRFSCALRILVLPEAKISDSCLRDDGVHVIDGYIKEGVTVRCSCYLTTLGLPRGTVAWYKNNRSLSNASTVVIQHDAEPSSYTCRGVSKVGTGSGDSIIATFAKGPTEVMIKKLGPKPETAGCKDSWHFACEIEENTFTPNISMFFQTAFPNATSDINQTVAYTYSRDGARRVYTASVCADERGGLFNVTCIARNSVFDEVAVESTLQMNETRATASGHTPPRTLPTIIVMAAGLILSFASSSLSSSFSSY